MSGLPKPDRCVVMGVLNITPDSFSDGGRYANLDAALAHARQMWAEGADLVDVGGESTRPGADRVDAVEEISRVLPAIRALAAEGVVVSVDTMRAKVAEAAIDAGAAVVNDVSGGRADPAMARVVAATGVPWILMHWRGHSRDMQELARYRDVVAEVRTELFAQVDIALTAGVRADRIAIDPGLGFAKSAEHNWQLLDRLGELVGSGLPVLVGSSRKSFLGAVLAEPGGQPRPVWDREDGTVATTVIVALAGGWGVRVHEVRRNLDAVRVVAAYQRAAG